MYLTKEEEGMLAGREGHATKKSMEILVALGKIYDAERLVEVSSVQVSGVSYKNLGTPG
jgi:predicted aconitase